MPPTGWTRTVEMPPALIDAWEEIAGCPITAVAEANAFAHFALRFDPAARRCTVAPAHFVVAFPHANAAGPPRHDSALLSLRVGPCAVGDAAGAPRLGGDGGDGVEFELLARPGDCPLQRPLRFTSGPVRVNAHSGQRESLRLDLGRAVRWGPRDTVTGTVGGAAQELTRQRWWVSLETIRFVCMANGVNASGLDDAGAPALEWIACLVDDRPTAATRIPDTEEVLAAFLGGAGGVPRPPATAPGATPAAACRNGQDPGAGVNGTGGSGLGAHGVEAELNGTDAKKHKAKKKGKTQPQAADPEWSPPLGEVNVNPVQPPLCQHPAAPVKREVLSFPDFREVEHVAEASGFVQFELHFDSARSRRVVAPPFYIVTFPMKTKGRQRHTNALLALRMVDESKVPQGYQTTLAQVDRSRGDLDYVEFELLLRVSEVPPQLQLHVNAGPVRSNPQTGQRESMRIDLGRCVRQIHSDVVEDTAGKLFVRNRWWICVETLRVVCSAHQLDCRGLDAADGRPVEWVLCLVDQRDSKPAAAAPEDRNIDDLVDFISNNSATSKKKKKKKDRDKEDQAEVEESFAARVSASQAAAAALSPQRAPHFVGLGGAVSSSGGAAAPQPAPRADPVAQAQAAAEMLAEVAAQCDNPEQAAAIHEAIAAAKRAADVVAGRSTAPLSRAAASSGAAATKSAPRAQPRRP